VGKNRFPPEYQNAQGGAPRLIPPSESASRGLSPHETESLISESPDSNAAGFLSESPKPIRYDHVDDNPREVASLIAGFVPEGARVLDVGCGTGALSMLIQKLRSAQVFGVEPDADRVEVARARGIDVTAGYLTDEVIATLGKFKVVVFADVLEHVPNPSALLKLGCSALDPDGVAVISVPNVAHWSVRWALLRGRFDYEQYGIMDATHLRWFTSASLRRWLENNGFTVEAVEQSAGTTLPVYSQAWPWRVIHPWRRSKLVRILARAWPDLFGCQHIVRARPGGR